MKKFYLFFLTCISLNISEIKAQCDPVVTFHSGSICSTPNNQTALLASGACANGVLFVLDWQFSNGVSGTAQFTTSQFSYPLNITSDVTQVCASVVAYDSGSNQIGSFQNCFPVNISPPMNIEVEVVSNPTPCNLNGGCVSMSASGGIPPYHYYVAGSGTSNGLNNGSVACGLTEGNHYAYVTDSTGCAQYITYNIPFVDPIGVSGTVFNDLNSNGTQGTGLFVEAAVANQPIHLVELNMTAYSDTLGHFNFPNVPDGTYTLEWLGDGNAWTTATSFSVNSPGCINIPLHSTTPFFNQYSGLSNWSSLLQCQNGLNVGLWVANIGNAAFDGTLTITASTSLSFSPTTTGIPFNTQNGGVITWNINDQQPGESLNYNVHINGPGPGFIGQHFPLTIHLVLYDDAENIFFENTWTQNPVVSCSYDPNDKTAMPEGYAEPHFILEDTELTYRIRFQNTGNAPAERVEIIDQLDVDHLDLASFQPLTASHNMQTLVNDNGDLRFIFNNIDLPDSLSDPEGSQGYVIYKIRTHPSISIGDVIENTANIYFDENPAVVTNTTWHTIYDCGSLQNIAGASNTCKGSEVYINQQQNYVEEYNWSIDGQPVSNSAEISFIADEIGQHTLLLQLTNPLCESEGSKTIAVVDVPDVSLVYYNDILTASPEGIYTWYLNGEVIEGATGNHYQPAEDGEYSVSVENEFGCTGTSAPYFVVGVKEKSPAALFLYPNPFEDISTLRLPQGVWKVEMRNVTGEIVKLWPVAQNGLQINRNGMAGGMYSIQAISNSGQNLVLPVLVK
ncbi:MAG: hypothetical protein IT223_11150 [Crocinitomicaceae bacterium]|nr:hypothetical protein [Crocinitomicaceae bacterium]